MTTDEQVMELRRLLNLGKTLKLAAMKTGMDSKTARKYRGTEQLPGEMKIGRNWCTRKDPFEGVWPEILENLEVFPELEAKTLFDALQRDFPGRFADGQLRTLQRRIKWWKATQGPPKEVYFPQEHWPAELCASDFTSMNSLDITISRQTFNHLLYHFVLTYSNWETGSVCFSESYESLSAGLQNALWTLGGVPKKHRTDRLSAAVNNLDEKKEFTRRYQGLLRHYRLEAQKIQAGHAHENGDIEQRHYRIKKAVDQALMLRGSRDFESRHVYEQFLKEMFSRLNKGRTKRLKEEILLLRTLPHHKLDDSKPLKVRVTSGSTIRVQNNVYSVHSRLVGEWVDVRVYAEHLELWYGQTFVERLPRMRGRSKHRIEYRHIIDWLLRKPGAFANYRYQSDLFPTSQFRIAYDVLNEQFPAKTADKEYLNILNLAAKESETFVNQALKTIIKSQKPISFDRIAQMVQSSQHNEVIEDPLVETINLNSYDQLLEFI